MSRIRSIIGAGFVQVCTFFLCLFLSISLSFLPTSGFDRLVTYTVFRDADNQDAKRMAGFESLYRHCDFDGYVCGYVIAECFLVKGEISNRVPN